VDALTGLLDAPRARGAFMLRSVMDPPWSMRIEDEAPLSVIAIVRGHAVIVAATELRLDAGDIALVRGPKHYIVTDDPIHPPTIVIGADQQCTSLDGTDLSVSMDLGVRTWGNAIDGATMMLTGTYEHHSATSHDLLAALPEVIAIHRDEWDGALIDLLCAEIVKTEPGQQVVLDRLLDLLVVAVIRTWCSNHEAEVAPWWHASRDPIIGRALRLLHNAPEQPWTIANLATAVDVSRAWLARRFVELVGEPPIGYLTRLRLALAADMLGDTQLSISAIAERVGYGSPFALSTAFKRRYATSPTQHRATVRHHDRSTIGS